MDRLTHCLLDEATATATKIVDDMPFELWTQSPAERFGPGEQFVHMAQSEQFALQFIFPAAGIGVPFVLGPPFTDIVAIPDLAARHRALSKLNLDGARGGLAKFGWRDELCSWWKRKRAEAVQALAQIPDDDTILWRDVQHPLVPNLNRPLVVMVHILFAAHPFYHSGQTTALFKELGRAEAVPFPFGEFE